MKKKMLKFRNQFFILGLGSMLIVSCTKEDFLDVVNHEKEHNKIDTNQVDCGGCLGPDTLDEEDFILCATCPDFTDSTDVTPVDPDSTKEGGYEYFDSVYNNPNYDSEKDGLLLSH
jgi:hypothetical protein